MWTQCMNKACYIKTTSCTHCMDKFLSKYLHAISMNYVCHIKTIACTHCKFVMSKQLHVLTV